MSSEPRARCGTCPHRCILGEGVLGGCRARIGRGGAVVPAAYGELTALALDPIEKKPIARWRGGSTVLSLGGFGCNMACPWCQNADIACAGPGDAHTERHEPAELVELALSLAGCRCIGIAYTYNEPLTSWEFVRDTARLAHEAGLANVLVSNGMASPAVIEELAPLMDAANIDLKAPTPELYEGIGGDLGAVQRSIRALHDAGCHVEATTLVVPGFNDEPGQIAQMAAWLASVSPQIPYHLTRFFPRHRLAGVPPTPFATLEASRDVAAQHLECVLLGNV